MNPDISIYRDVSSHASWWSPCISANPWEKQEKDESELVRIDTEDFSDHMLGGTSAYVMAEPQEANGQTTTI